MIKVRADLGLLLKLVKYEQVQQTIRNSINILGYEIVRTENAHGRILADGVTVAQDQPTFADFAVDGYAIDSSTAKSATRTSPASYEIVGEVFPDDASENRIKPDQTFYVSCGSRIPQAADCVVKAELVEKQNGTIKLSSPIAHGKNISYTGEDFKVGTKLFSSYHKLRPQDIAALLATGHIKVKVLKRPVAGVLSVGSELTDARNPTKGCLVNDHAYVLLGFLREFEVETVNLGVCPDETEKISAKLRDAIQKCDMVITLGGTSVGKKDLVPNAILSLGAKEMFHGMRMSPGKVNGLMMVREKPVVMLAGHIVTALAGFFTIVVPILQHMQNMSKQMKVVSAVLAEDVKMKAGTDRFLLVHIKNIDGQQIATPFGLDTNLLSSLVSANAYSIVPSDSEPKAGESLEFHPLNLSGSEL